MIKNSRHNLLAEKIRGSAKAFTARFAASLAAALLLAMGLIFSSCGVRGRPQPPLTPAEIGHGQPTFKRTSSEDAFQNIPSPDTELRPENRPEPTATPGAFSGEGN